MKQDNKPRMNEWTLEELLRLTLEEARALWTGLAPPGAKEMNGEYAGRIPMDGGWYPVQTEAGRKEQLEMMFSEDGPLGYWLGKSFIPSGNTGGEGYNQWRRANGNIERYMRFKWMLGTSNFDGRPSLIMDFSHYQPFGAGASVDELRKLADGLYLGMASVPNPDGGWMPLAPFSLSGPVDGWVGVDDPEAEVIGG